MNLISYLIVNQSLFMRDKWMDICIARIEI